MMHGDTKGNARFESATRHLTASQRILRPERRVAGRFNVGLPTFLSYFVATPEPKGTRFKGE
jgi:hypothetical protein